MLSVILVWVIQSPKMDSFTTTYLLIIGNFKKTLVLEFEVRWPASTSRLRLPNLSAEIATIANLIKLFCWNFKYLLTEIYHGQGSLVDAEVVKKTGCWVINLITFASRPTIHRRIASPNMQKAPKLLDLKKSWCYLSSLTVHQFSPRKILFVSKMLQNKFRLPGRRFGSFCKPTAKFFNDSTVSTGWGNQHFRISICQLVNCHTTELNLSQCLSNDDVKVHSGQCVLVFWSRITFRVHQSFSEPYADYEYLVSPYPVSWPCLKNVLEIHHPFHKRECAKVIGRTRTQDHQYRNPASNNSFSRVFIILRFCWSRGKHAGGSPTKIPNLPGKARIVWLHKEAVQRRSPCGTFLLGTSRCLYPANYKGSKLFVYLYYTIVKVQSDSHHLIPNKTTRKQGKDRLLKTVIGANKKREKKLWHWHAKPSLNPHKSFRFVIEWFPSDSSKSQLVYLLFKKLAPLISYSSRKYSCNMAHLRLCCPN